MLQRCIVALKVPRKSRQSLSMNDATTKAHDSDSSSKTTEHPYPQIHTILTYYSQQSPLTPYHDTYITSTFQDILLTLSTHSSLRESWRHELINEWRGKVALIIIMYHFARHMHRHYISIASNMESNNPLFEQQRYDDMAKEFSDEFYNHHEKDVYSGIIPMSCVLATLSPLQLHNRDFAKTIMKNLTKQADHFTEVLRNNFHDVNALMNFTSSEHMIETILSHQPFGADMSTASSHLATSTLTKFCQKYDINTETHLLLSVSGGVDSMVLLRSFVYLRDSCHSNVDIHVLHINYKNRSESCAEASYVEKYCHSLNVKYHVFVMDMVRSETDRDIYEKHTRSSRYQFYKNMIRQYFVKGVFIAHHQDDVRENVISNIHNGHSLLELSGMSEVSVNNNVTLFRPFITLEKSILFHYAHQYGIPYFKDTTPIWSVRGKLRCKVLPLLKTVYGNGSKDHLSTIAKESNELQKFLRNTILPSFTSKFKHTQMGLILSTQRFRNQPHYFWKFLLRHVFHQFGFAMWTEKSLQLFIKRIHQDHIKEGWMQCHKDYGVYVQTDGKAFIFYKDSFPWRDNCNFDKIIIPYNIDPPIRVGRWSITATIIPHLTESSSQKYLYHKAIDSMESFMRGKIAYYLPIPIERKDSKWTSNIQAFPLEIIKEYTKETRPYAWKGVDGKIQQKIPLVGLCEEGRKKWDLLGYQKGGNKGEKKVGRDWCVGRVVMEVDKLVLE